MAANQAEKTSLKSYVLLNQYAYQLKTLKGPKQGMRLPSLGVNPTSFESLIVDLKITGVVPQSFGHISCSSFFLLHTLRCVFALSDLSHSSKSLSLAKDGGYSLPDMFLREQFPPLI
jgi:hypothetical protein